MYSNLRDDGYQCHHQYNGHDDDSNGGSTADSVYYSACASSGILNDTWRGTALDTSCLNDGVCSSAIFGSSLDRITRADYSFSAITFNFTEEHSLVWLSVLRVSNSTSWKDTGYRT